MKYLINESRFHNFLIDMFRKYVDLDNIHEYHPIEDNSDGEQYEDKTRTIFYFGDDMYDTEDGFYYYECDYFYDSATEQKEICPILQVSERISDTFNSYFTDLWKEPFKEWINQNLNLNVKTVE